MCFDVEGTQQALAFDAAMRGVDHVVTVVALLGPPLDILQDDYVVGENVGARYPSRHEAAHRARDRRWNIRTLKRFLCARLADGV